MINVALLSAKMAEMAEMSVSVSDIWATSGVLLGLQVAAMSYRVSAETARRQELLDEELLLTPPFLSPCELLNLIGMAVCVLLVFVLPMTLHSDGLVQVGFSVYALLYAAYPFALLGHHSMFSSFLTADPEPPPPASTRQQLCTEQERNVILVTTVAVCAQLLGSLVSPGGGAVAIVVIVLCPAALCFYALVHRAADDGETTGRRGKRRAGASARKKPYRQLTDGSGTVVIDEEAEDFRYEVQIDFEVGSREDIGLELREARDGIEVSDVRPDSLAAKAPHVCPGMVLVRIASAVRPERSALELSVEDVLSILDEERPVSLIFEHPWQRELDKDDEV